MGKKRIIEQTKEDVLQERDQLDKALKSVKIKEQGKIRQANIYVNCSYTNTCMTLTDKQGNTLAWSSAGLLGFKGTKKSTSYAASKVAEVLAKKAEAMGIKEAEILVKGIGSGRRSVLRVLPNFGLELTAIKDITPIPHNGCRPRKPRRT